MKKYERKYLILNLEMVWNKLINKKSIEYERYFIYIEETEQIRAKKTGDKYEIESIIGDYRKKLKITQKAFQQITQNCDKVIKRHNYQLSNEMKFKVYDGQYKGLFIIDIEFETSESYNKYKKPNWFGPEITSTKLGSDGSIIQLTPKEVFDYIKDFQKDNDFKEIR